MVEWGGLRWFPGETHCAPAMLECILLWVPMCFMTVDVIREWWFAGGEATLDLVAVAERRFRALAESHRHDLASSDALAAATLSALASVSANPCPDHEAQALITSLLNAYGRVANLTVSALSDSTTSEDDVAGQMAALQTEIMAGSKRLPERIDELLRR